jgi:putative membrane fusion protein
MKNKPAVFNNITANILLLLIVALLLTTVGSQLYRYINDHHDTMSAVLCTINDDISFKGIIVRDETQMTYSTDDVISYSYPDGSKVSKGAAVAQIFESENAAAVESKTQKLEEEIAQLERAQNPGTTDYVQPESISEKIDDYYKQLITYSNEGDFDDFDSVKSDMTLVMNIYNIISGISTDYNSKIAELESVSAQLKSQSSEVKDTIAATETGYFVSYCDGYETVLNKENVYSLSESEIEGIVDGTSDVKNTPPSNAIGKMFDDYSCCIAAVIDTDSRVTEGSYLSLMLDSSDTVYDVYVESVKAADESGKSIIILSCDSLDEAFVYQRVQSMQLIFDEYSGIKVPRSAIRFQGEQKGVYVILGENITFKKIDVVYEGDDYVLSKNTSDEDCLLLYDQILLEVVSEQDVQYDNSSLESTVSGGA